MEQRFASGGTEVCSGWNRGLLQVKQRFALGGTEVCFGWNRGLLRVEQRFAPGVRARCQRTTAPGNSEVQCFLLAVLQTGV